MQLPKELTTIAPFSKYIAMTLFILLPFLGFYLGIKYQSMLTQPANISILENKRAIPSPTVIPIGITASSWKTYSTTQYSIQYPANWFVYKYPGAPDSIILSDIPNPIDIPRYISPNNHQIVNISFTKDGIPTDFPYMNGASTPNQTIKKITLNGYNGIRGFMESTIGLTDAVFLTDPNGGSIDIEKEIGDSNTFNQILFSLKFISPMQSSSIQNWQQYQNQTLGISFSYPANFKTVPYTLGDGINDIGVIGLLESNQPDNALPIITLRYWNNPKLLTLKAYDSQFQNTSAVGNGLLGIYSDTAEQTIIGGTKAYFFPKSENCDPFYCDMYIIPLGNKIFEIRQFLQTGNHPDISDSSISTIFKTIISTVKFQ